MVKQLDIIPPQTSAMERDGCFFNSPIFPSIFMNTILLKFLRTLLFLPLLGSFSRAAVVDATFTSASDVPVTAGSYTATGNTVNLVLSFAPPTGTNLTVVKNSGLAYIQGVFGNLPQGQVVNLTYSGISYPFVADYFGGTGNDLVTFSLALCSDGSVVAWGEGSNGQLGNGATVSSNVPVAVDTSGILAGKTVTALAAGSVTSVALCADGAVAGWGGYLGYGWTNSSTVPIVTANAGVLAGRTVSSHWPSAT